MRGGSEIVENLQKGLTIEEVENHCSSMTFTGKALNTTSISGKKIASNNLNILQFYIPNILLWYEQHNKVIIVSKYNINNIILNI